jgi:lincosamide nucleotidyltransferase A/C/D/E
MRVGSDAVGSWHDCFSGQIVCAPICSTCGEAIVRAEVVVELLDLLHSSGVDSWVDGGWGVDALLGYQSRPHEDLDLVVALDRVSRIREVLDSHGFTLSEDQLPVRFVLSHPHLGHIDFHTVTFDREGGGLQPQPSGKTFRYPPDGFVGGQIADRPVRCISARVQVLCHLGYEPKEKDVHDVRLLHQAFGVELPAAYRPALGED